MHIRWLSILPVWWHPTPSFLQDTYIFLNFHIKKDRLSKFNSISDSRKYMQQIVRNLIKNFYKRVYINFRIPKWPEVFTKQQAFRLYALIWQLVFLIKKPPSKFELVFQKRLCIKNSDSISTGKDLKRLWLFE